MAKYTITYEAEYENGEIVIDKEVLRFKNKDEVISYLMQTRFMEASFAKEA